VIVALSLPMLVAVADDRSDGDAPGASKTILATDLDGKIRREIYVEGRSEREVASLVAGKAPLIGFIESPGASCSQPNPRKDDCYVNWTYLYVGAAPNYMIAMWAQLETDVVLKVSGFFQTSMYVSGQSLGLGFRVPCGAPIDDASSCPSPPGGCVPLKVGNSYGYTVKALDSAGLRSANYGTVTCPAFVGAGYYTLPPCRVLDTRGAPSGPLAGPALQPGETRSFDLSASTCGVPSGAWAVSINATVTAPVAAGSLTLYPGDEEGALTSTINFTPGRTLANNAVVALASDFSGSIRVKNNSAGTVHFILDVNGYFK
jgi:hypothetical protein